MHITDWYDLMRSDTDHCSRLSIVRQPILAYVLSFLLQAFAEVSSQVQVGV